MSVRTGSGAWKLLIDSLGVHRRVTGSAGVDPRRKAMDSNSSTGATKRFDGAGEDATRRYWKWRK